MTFDAPEEMKKGSGSKKSKCGPEEFSGAYTYISPVGKPLKPSLLTTSKCIIQYECLKKG